MRPETFKARAFDSRGRLLGSWEGVTVASTIAKVPADVGDVVVRGERTSDGAFWRDHGGRVVAVRENGKWVSF